MKSKKTSKPKVTLERGDRGVTLRLGRASKGAPLKLVTSAPRKGRTTPAYPPLDKSQVDEVEAHVVQLDGEPAMPFGFKDEEE